MSEKQAYLLLQSIGEIKDFDFNSPLANVFNNELKEKDYFILDNSSDLTSMDYAKQFIDRSELLIVICDEIVVDSLGSLLPILNKCVKRKNTKLFCVGESKLLSPFIKMMKGEVFLGGETLIQKIILNA